MPEKTDRDGRPFQGICLNHKLMNVYDHIEDYLNGDLTGDERSIFEKALRVDPELELAVKRYQHTIAHLDALRLREKIRENLVHAPAAGVSGPTGIWKYTAVAAAIVVLVVAAYFIFGPKEEPLMAVTTTPEMPSVMDNAPTTPEIAETPADLPWKGNGRSTGKIIGKDNSLYSEAVAALDEISYTYLDGQDQKDDKLEARLNSIIGLLRNNRQDEAVAMLEVILNSGEGTSAYREDAEWLLSIALITKDREKSREILVKIAGNPAHSYRVKAIRLLEKME